MTGCSTHHRARRLGLVAGWLLVGTLVLAGCSRGDAAAPQTSPVRSYLEGRLTVNPAVDSIPDYRDFQVLVANTGDQQADTLGYAVTDSTGFFRMDVTAPDRGIYPIIVSRRGTVLKVDELAVANGDSATLTAEFPVGNRSLRIRSPENAAWTAYRNTRAQHNQQLVTIFQSGNYDEEQLRQAMERTAMIYWSLRETFPNTIGGAVAAAEAVALLGGWNDSLAVAHAREIEPDNPGYVEVVRVARQAQARLTGQEAAVALVRELQEKATDRDDQAGIQSEIVIAYMDSLQQELALEAAQTLIREYDNTGWAAWAERAVYELENLMPGMPAPAFAVTTYDGEKVSLEELRGKLVLLEFYAPQATAFQRELGSRSQLARMVGPDSLAIVSVSVLPDTLLNEAFYEGRDFPGLKVIAPEGLESDIAKTYNVNALPTRYLIDADGSIVAKYVGGAMTAIQRDVAALLGGPADVSETSTDGAAAPEGR